MRESKCNDERLKLVNDLVIGARTIKSYGWELKYIEKITKARVEQVKSVFKLMLNEGLGPSIFNNMGLITVFFIIYYDWRDGKKLDNALAVSTMALIYFLFFSVNLLLYFAVINIQNFFTILKRMSEVFCMEEH